MFSYRDIYKNISDIFDPSRQNFNTYKFQNIFFIARIQLIRKTKRGRISLKRNKSGAKTQCY